MVQNFNALATTIVIYPSTVALNSGSKTGIMASYLASMVTSSSVTPLPVVALTAPGLTAFSMHSSSHLSFLASLAFYSVFFLKNLIEMDLQLFKNKKCTTTQTNWTSVSQINSIHLKTLPISMSRQHLNHQGSKICHTSIVITSQEWTNENLKI